MPEEKEKGLFGRVLEDIKSFFKIQFQTAWEDFFDGLGRAFSGWFELWFKPAVKPNLGSTGCLADLINAGILRVEDANRIDNLLKTTGIWRMPLEIMFSLILLMRYADSIVDVLSSKNIQELNKKYAPYPPGAGELLRALFIAPELSDKIIDRIKASGISEEDIKLLILASYATYPVEVIKDLYLRGVLNEEKMYERMRELGFTDTRIKELVAGWEVIPSPQDLLWMVGKEAFEPDAIKMMGLSDEFPEEQVRWLQAQGVSREWALKYWYAHWNQPSIEQGFEMLHRGVIGWKELDMLFRTVEIPPYWRKKLTAIAYAPYTRVDVRRMYEAGVLTEQDVYENYLDLGYDDKHATQLTLWTIKEYQAENRELTRSQILSGYAKRAISRKKTAEALKSLGYSADEVEYMLSLEDLKYEQSLQDDMIKNIEDRYINNLINKTDALAQLGKLGLPAEQIHVLLDRWEIKAFVDRKLPSKSDLGKWLISKVINEDEYRSEMRKLGYSWDQIDKYLKYVQKTKKAD